MKTTRLAWSRNSGLAAVLLLSLGWAAAACAAQEVLDVDLSPLIDQAARYTTRFAVDLPHAVSIADAGAWTQNGNRSTWTYSIRIPTAVSMSFHAARVNLPASAVLTVTGANGLSASYRAHDVARSGLWSRPLPGDSLLLSLSVDTAARSQTLLELRSFQAGYRSLGAGVPDNVHYRSLMQNAAQLSNCVVNYACEASGANQGPAQSTVAIVVSGVVQCTATLLNDTSSDGDPYLLTARHCESGALGGGDPGAAANVTVYWDAVTPCGGALGSIYDGNTKTQTGATTLVEQQDAWLIKLDSPVAANDAYYAGWDATGAVFTGGYSIHHALSYNKQYAGWYGQPILQAIPGATLGLGYTSNFWGVVNAVGNVGAGASGGALFDPNNNAVGSATLGELANGANSDGVCPVTPLQAASPSNITAMYTTLSAIWNSTADTTSTTGTATLQSVLDAAKTGKLVMAGMASLPITLTISQPFPLTGELVNLTWNAAGAQSCTASGGLTGDGWAGPQGASGTIALTEDVGSQVAYTISCRSGNQVGWAVVSVVWQLVPASVQISGSAAVAAGSLLSLQWTANSTPCTASGGTSGDGWAGAKPYYGSQRVLLSVLGSVTYTLTCGTGARTATNQFTVTVVPPSAGPINNDANDMLAGQPVTLTFGGGGSCVASGGAAGDGWAGPLSSPAETVSVTEATAGTYTYTITCSGAGATANLSATSSVTLVFTSGPPTASISVSPTSAEIYTDPGAAGNDNVNLTWTSNVRPCGVSVVGPGNARFTGPSGPGVLPSETIAEGEAVAGTYVFTITCGTGQNQAQASVSASYFTTTPGVTLTVPNPLPQGAPATISWVSNVYPCTGTGGESGDGWAGGPKAGAYFGIDSQTVTESATGTVTFGITCGSGSQVVQSQASTSVIAPHVSITAAPSTLPVDGSLVLQWSSNVEPCTSTITPGAPLGWTTLPSGSAQTTEPFAGTYIYAINCAGVQASTQVTFTGSLATLTANTSSATVDTLVYLSWSSPQNPQTKTSCTAGGGTPGDGWTGPLPGSGTKAVTAASVSTVIYSISCDFGYGPAPAQTQVSYTALPTTGPTIPTPRATLLTSAPSQVVGSSVTLSWTSQNANACTATGGANGDGWSGPLLSLSGMMSVTESTAGSYTYGISCTGAPPAATATASVDFTNPTVTVTAGKGGGGTLDPWLVALLGLATYRRARLACRSRQ